MSTQVGADPDHLDEVANALERRADDVRAVRDRVHDALRALERSSSEFVPTLPAHRADIDDLAAKTDNLSGDVRTTAVLLRGADEGAWWAHRGHRRFSVATQLSGGKDSTWALGAGALWSSAAARTAHVNARWGSSTRIPMRHYRAVTGNPIGVANNRTLTPLRRAQELHNAAVRADAAETIAEAKGTLRSLHISNIVDEIAVVADDTAGLATRGRAAWSVGNRVLGVAGVAYSGYETVRHVMEGSYGDAASDAANAAGTVMMMTGTPPFQIAGAVLVAGSLVYEHRETIARAVTDPAGTVQDLGEGLVDVGSDVVNGARDLIGGLF